MKSVVIRLTGGGAISEASTEIDVPWWGYRNMHITPSVYSDLTALIANNPSTRFIFVCGGIGAFLFTDLVKNLAIDSYADEVGKGIISILNGIAISYLNSLSVNVYPNEVPANEVEKYLSTTDASCFFIKPDSGCISSDSLAAEAAFLAKADLLLYVKKGAPQYHVGFDKPTIINRWSLDDIELKSLTLYEEQAKHYVLDYQACSILKSNTNEIYIIPPEIIKEINTSSFPGSNSELVTRVY
ncbi:hypothetical protein [Pseudoalteromonas sp. SR43-3]|uniref:hypothetical protein n=1 Tax=Pseudoalteromonas sp. SR43-3 TaxID=2760943 RepID=UPI001600F6C5|nr:hypothetical protein [Pseudoalteromonas sp. SR43-3]MBB1275827.1 hypothetical protein [Pseudoalteromonas sp. SR43-3]